MDTGRSEAESPPLIPVNDFLEKKKKERERRESEARRQKEAEEGKQELEIKQREEQEKKIQEQEEKIAEAERQKQLEQKKCEASKTATSPFTSPFLLRPKLVSTPVSPQIPFSPPVPPPSHSFPLFSEIEEDIEQPKSTTFTPTLTHRSTTVSPFYSLTSSVIPSSLTPSRKYNSSQFTSPSKHTSLKQEEESEDQESRVAVEEGEEVADEGEVGIENEVSDLTLMSLNQHRVMKSKEKLRMLAEVMKMKTKAEVSDFERSKVSAAAKPLTPEEKERYKRIFGSDDDDVVSEIGNLKIKVSDLKTLIGDEWLNDEVVNFYMELLTQKYPTCHFFNTFFYNLMSGNRGYDYSRVKKWTRKVDIFQKDKVIIPVHLGIHWCLAVINIKEKRLEYYDSLLGANQACLHTLRKYLADEHKDKKSKELDIQQWEMSFLRDIPTQKNGYDCGVFMCKFAQYSAANQNFTFKQSEMQDIRKRMVIEIHTKQLVNL